MTVGLSSTAVVRMRSLRWQKRVIAAAPRPSCTAWPRVRSAARAQQHPGHHALHVFELDRVAACSCASRLAPMACRGAGSARRRIRRRWRAAVQASCVGSSLHASRYRANTSRHAASLRSKRPGGVGRAGGGQAMDRRGPACASTRIARADSPPLCAMACSCGARCARPARSLSSASSIALSRLPSRRQQA